MQIRARPQGKTTNETQHKRVPTVWNVENQEAELAAHVHSDQQLCGFADAERPA